MELHQFLYLSIVFSSLCLVSCTNKPTESIKQENVDKVTEHTKNQQNNAEGTDARIRIPIDDFELLSNYSDNGIDNTQLDAETYKFVVYIDSSICTTCEFQNLGTWNSLIRQTNQITDIDFFFILSPSKDNIEAIRDMYRFNRFLMDVYLDTEFKFEKSNPIVKKSKLHHFLLNPKDSIIYVGNPTSDLKQKEKLLRILRGSLVFPQKAPLLQHRRMQGV